MDDEMLVDRLSDEVASALGTTSPPITWRVSRWPKAFPQYDVGHLARVERIERTLMEDVPELTVAGASYRGSGISACIASGRRAAAIIQSSRAPSADSAEQRSID